MTLLSLHGTADITMNCVAGECQWLTITGSGFSSGVYNCLFKRGAQRVYAAATRVDSEHVKCVIPAWDFESGKVQLILVKENYGPIRFAGDAVEDEMFSFLPEWGPLTSSPSIGPASGGTVVSFSAYGFLSGWSWYRCVFQSPPGALLMMVLEHSLSNLTKNPTGQNTSGFHHTFGEQEEMSVPAQVNSTHVMCTTPSWGSLFTASTVNILLYDGDIEIAIPSNFEGEGLPAFCSSRQPSVDFIFTPLWDKVSYSYQNYASAKESLVKAQC